MFKDRFDQPVSAASAQAVERNDDAVDRIFALQPGAEALVDEALAADADFALAHCTKARALLQNGDGAGGRRWAKRAQELAAPLSERERSHAEIVCRAIHGESATALRMVREHAAAWPRDAVPFSFALGVYGLLGFGGFKDFEAQQVALLESVASAWGDEDWWYLAARGWALVEVGESERGIAMLERALDRNAANANAVHAARMATTNKAPQPKGMRSSPPGCRATAARPCCMATWRGIGRCSRCRAARSSRPCASTRMPWRRMRPKRCRCSR